VHAGPGSQGRVIGFDIACLNPMLDTAFYGGITIHRTSYVIAYFLGYIFEARRDIESIASDGCGRRM
jgi:hypothetical protein